MYRDGGHGSTLDAPVIGEIARAHGKTPAQVRLRWVCSDGRSVIPKSTKPNRIAENINMFDLELSADDGRDRWPGHRPSRRPEPEARPAAHA